MADWHLYLVRTADGALYTGISTDVERRFAEHRDGKLRGARFLRGRGPLELVSSWQIGERGLAQKAESRLKRLPKSRKEEIARDRPEAREMLALLELEDG